MKHKLLFLLIIILLPIALLISKKEEVIIKSNENQKEEVIVNLINNNESIKIGLNDYLIGVVGQEMPASFNIEALKAQAVAARTFAYNYYSNGEINIKSSAQNYINLDQMKEKWLNNFSNYYKKIKEAVESTDKEVIKYNGNIIKAYYYAISNGKSENSISVFNEELPYISVVDSSFDENVKNFEVTTSFTYDNFCKLLNINNCNIDISDIKYDESNRVDKIVINDMEYSGVDVRKKLNLRSADFIIEKKQNSIEITTKGYGHGVGMSQYGANYLANHDYNYKEILKYYYKDVEILKL